MKSQIKNVAIIMDGNGRWANMRGHSRYFGHVRGASIVSKIVETSSDYGLNSLTLYAFSTENFQRPQEEKSILFKLLKKFLLKEFEKIVKNNIQFKVIGSIEFLTFETQSIIKELTKKTSQNSGMKLNFAFAYGSRNEIVSAFNKAIESGIRVIDEEKLSSFLYDPSVGEIDLLIRTGGDKRISNFLLWQIAYAELYFSSTLWPDFKEEELIKIISEVEKRHRRFGKVEDHVEHSSSI